MSLIFIFFDLFWFDSNLRRIRFIELSSEKGGTNSGPISKKNLDFGFFPLGLSNFWVGAWFPFDEGQSSQGGIFMTIDIRGKYKWGKKERGTERNFVRLISGTRSRSVPQKSGTCSKERRSWNAFLKLCLRQTLALCILCRISYFDVHFGQI